MRIPISVKQFPRMVLDLRQKREVLRQPAPATRTRFHLCFFSCLSYYPYLACALHSLTRLDCRDDLRVVVFNDQDMPMSAEQIAALGALDLDLEVVTWPKSVGWTIDQIDAIWRAYAYASASAADHDYVARVDADVFFFNSTVFDAVARSGADMVGDGHYVDFEYCQGGCYFFRVAAARRVNQLIAERSVAGLAKEFPTLVEDVAATHMARTLGLRVWMTWFMMFPDELRNAGMLGERQHERFSCLHFVMKNKTAMLEAYERHVLRPEEREHYDALLRCDPALGSRRGQAALSTPARAPA